MKPVVLVSLVVAFSGCTGESGGLPTGPTPVTANVEFRYVARGAAESLASSELPCAGPVSVLPSFWGFAQVTMEPIGEGVWAVVVEDVPVGTHRVKVRAPDGCGSSTLYANGTRVHEELTVNPDGRVSR